MRAICTILLTCAVSAAAVSGYERPVHLSVTMALAEIAGLQRSIAFEIARYDQATDDDPATDPLPLIARTARANFHFVTPQRLTTLKSIVVNTCRSAAPEPQRMKAIGQYFHAFEDSYSHRGYGADFGHASALHTPDKPWTQPTVFREMVINKLGELVDIGERCFGLGVANARVRFSMVAVPILDAWVLAETQAGTGDPSLGQEARWDQMLRQLFGPDFDRYTRAATEAYDQWLVDQRRGPWR